MPLIKVLGPLELSIAGRQATPRGVRERKLLALLAINANSIVATERIVDALWESPPNSARQQIHNVVGALRRTLIPAVGVELFTDSSGYQLKVPAEAMDALQFRSAVEAAETAEQHDRLDDAVRLLDEALGLWRGGALRGLDGRVLTNAATLLDAQRLTAVERWAELRLRLGRAALAVDGLNEMLAEHPLREPLRALLMTALYQCGRQSEAMIVFEDGRRLLAEELGLDPGPQLREAHRQILHAEPAASAQPRDSQAEGLPERRRGQDPGSRSFLPRDIAEFTGREDELRRLCDRPFEPNAPSISVIDGMGGVGKTSLAVHLAHLLAGDYPDGQYFVDLAGFSEQAEPMSPMQALNLLLRFDGMAPELIAPDLEARSAQWRSSLAGRRILILLDNAADPTQVRSLLPGSAESLVLISSRRRMVALEGAAALSLDIMTEPDAVALFCRIAGPERVAEEPEAVRSAVELCGYLPLAIQIAAARLRERSSWRVSFLVDQLRDYEARARILAAGDRDVMNIVAWSYHHLTERQQRLLGLLSLHAGPDFDVCATAALSDLRGHQVEEDLDKLFELNLLKQHVADRYHLHDIVRDCSRRLLEATVSRAEVADAAGRLADYYLWSAGSWCGLLSKTSLRFAPEVERRPESARSAADAKDAMRLLETEFRNIIATLRLAADFELHSRVWQMMRTLHPYFSALNYPAESEPLFELGRLAARAAESLVGEAACLSGLASVQRTHGSVAEALKLGERALALSRQAEDRVGEVAQLVNLGVSHWTARDLDRARECYGEALRVARELGDRQLQASLTNNLAIVSQELGRNGEALRYFLEARSLGGQSAGPGAETATLNNIGFVSVVLGDWEGAAVIYKQSLELSRAAGVELSEALALVGLCIVRRGMGEYDRAIAYGRAALDLARRTSTYDAEAQALNALGDVYACDGELATAEQVFQQSLKAASARDSARYAARAHEGLAHVASLRGDVGKALGHWEAALSTNPGGVVDAAGAERHLAAPEAGAATCWRCRSVGAR
ncbi:DNA-binding SARP family transcriptional activator/Tfp pilus assembly protein PilF [Streptacidiphilus sp. MAP12-16]|uniref:AfsR/SARP family transcriptional regulator n=1 Tax=Streptacidiphilus sp. MAP12-16 TaxID=3156300 RepID=UPI0035134F3C